MNPFSNTQIYGENPFFNSPNYETELKKEFDNSPNLTYESSQKIEPVSLRSTLGTVVRKILKILCCPTQKSPPNLGSKLVAETTDWKYKRLTLKVDGNSIDATLMVRPKTAINKKWVIASIGRYQRYEDRLTEKAFQSFLEQTESNAILFNYAKMGVSTGKRNPQTMTAAYKAALEFLEDEEKGIGAKKIIGYGYSMGGGVQGKALESYNLESGLKKGIQYLFIKDRTFSELAAVIKSYSKGFIRFLPRCDWRLESVESSKKLADLKIPEIIVQTTDENLAPISDGVISKNASLKSKISMLPREMKAQKWYINIQGRGLQDLHYHSMDCFVDQLSKKVNEIFPSDPQEKKPIWSFPVLSYLNWI